MLAGRRFDLKYIRSLLDENRSLAPTEKVFMRATGQINVFRHTLISFIKSV